MVKLVTLIGLCAAPLAAHADHQHGMMTGASEGSSEVSVGVALVAATFDTMIYGGDYQAIIPTAGWAAGRFAVAGRVGIYRLQENGRELYGAGDAMVHGQLAIVDRPDVGGGVAIAASAPTGDHLTGLGMGHPMVMPAAWGRWRAGPWATDASVGYGRALGASESHHDHGAWPLVEPMNASEVTWTASGNFAVTRQLRAGARVGGAFPTGEGVTRVSGGVRVLWTEGRVGTAFELQAGIAGDPFTLRGVLETALRF